LSEPDRFVFNTDFDSTFAFLLRENQEFGGAVSNLELFIFHFLTQEWRSSFSGWSESMELSFFNFHAKIQSKPR
jgi:hypothetical protein